MKNIRKEIQKDIEVGILIFLLKDRKICLTRKRKTKNYQNLEKIESITLTIESFKKLIGGVELNFSISRDIIVSKFKILISLRKITGNEELEELKKIKI